MKVALKFVYTHMVVCLRPTCTVSSLGVPGEAQQVFIQSNLLLSVQQPSMLRGSAANSTGTVCNVPWTKPQHLNTVIRARAGYWLNYT